METMSVIEGGDTAWLLIATILVMLMTPGLALFYGGMVQSKNVLATFMHSFWSLAIITLQWVVIGYSLVFGTSFQGLFGGLNFAFLQGVGLEARGTVPHLLFMMFQGMFAIITPALISGAFAERLKFSAFCLFTLLWSTLVYDPVAHWVWSSEGWLFKLGALDFAGGTVVHLAAGISALVAALVVGKRYGYPHTRHFPHNLTMTVLGGALLWFGWFGFNAGSALSAGGLGVLALVNTQLAAATGALAWGCIEWLKLRKITMLGVTSGFVAGLVGVTPAAGFIAPMSALAIGVLAGSGCFVGVWLKSKFGYDDALDAFGVHGVGGAIGALATGVFASKAFNPAGADGLWYGESSLLLKQGLGVLVVALYASIMSWLILKFIDLLVGLRVDKDIEQAGLDYALHGETGFAFDAHSTQQH